MKSYAGTTTHVLHMPFNWKVQNFATPSLVLRAIILLQPRHLFRGVIQGEAAESQILAFAKP